ncbi:MAG: glycosyltransferase [Acidobacteriota bacterium]|nr:glycosyltransferase [Acidobacteriota bacterium]MDE3265495.1 glycosyltransferase [Acidobacteriota bacterium]
MPPQLSIVAPVYNEAGNLERLVAETRDSIEAASLDYELILVDDHSTDGSRDELVALATDDERLRVLSLERHAGQSAALLAGLRAASAPLVVTMDADLQNDPADIPAIVALLEDHDVVSGVRAKRRDTLLRRLASRVSNRIRRLVLGDPCTDIGCALKGYRAATLEDVPPFDGLHRFLPLLALRHGGSYAELPVRHRARTEGASKYNIRGRFLRGVLDLFGVSWYRRRAVSVTVKALERSPCHPSHPISSGR